MPKLGLGTTVSKKALAIPSIYPTGRTFSGFFSGPNDINASPELIDNTNWSLSGSGTIDWVSNGRGSFSVTSPSADSSWIIQSAITSSSVLTYKLTYTISNATVSGGANLRLSGGNSAFGTVSIPSTNGTHTVYLESGENGGATNLQINENGFVGTISDISLIQLTSIGGQGLEFDGVSDQIDFNPIMGGESEMTISVWVKKDVGAHATDDGAITGYNSGGTYLRFTSDTKLHFFVLCDTENLSFNADWVDDGKWHYVVATFNQATNGRIYIDGELIQESSTRARGNTNATTGRIASVGNYSTAGTYLFSGQMCNFQVWDQEWSAHDVIYSYNNGNNLVLDSNTNKFSYSNLKLWYPMVGGHRGDNAKLLDAANTGLGNDLISSMTSLSSGNTVTSSSVGGGTFTNNNDGTISFVNCDASGNQVQLLAAGIEQGISYKVSYTISDYSGGTMKVSVSNLTSGVQTRSGNGNYEDIQAYTNYTPGLASIYFYANTFTGTISNLSVKPINNKNHGTSLFYGDNLVTTGSGTGVAIADDTAFNFQSGTVTFANTSAEVDTSSNAGEITLNFTGTPVDDANAYAAFKMTTVVGRSYSVGFDHFSTAGNTNYRIGTSIGGVDVQAAKSVQAGANNAMETYSVGQDIWAATANTTWLTIHQSDSGKADLRLDNIVLKEVGFATGWTDVDAQPIIPQISFQHYNELSYFLGTVDAADFASIADNDALTPTTSGFSVSAWIFTNSNVSVPVLLKGTDEGDMEYVLYTHTNGKIIFRIGSHGSDGNYIGKIGSASSDALYTNEWVHLAATWNGVSAASGITLYVNGEPINTSTSSNGTLSLTAAGSANAALLVGKGVVGSDTVYANGCITEISLWHQELSLLEIQELYNYGQALDATSHSAGTTNLAGYWRNNSKASWKDLSPNNNTCVPQNLSDYLILPKGVNGRDSNGFIMNRAHNGLNNNSDTSLLTSVFLGDINTINAGTAFSITGWFRPLDFSSNHFIGHSETDFIRFKSATQLEIHANNAEDVFTVSTLTVDEWVHIGIVRNSSNLVTTYINGVAQANTQTVDEAFDYSSIGMRNQGAYKFRGAIDDLFIYNATELSASQVKRNYNAGKRRHRN